ncbi:LPXTG cell wall anchor domain-containing protein [Levilactobacillus tujiorum]|uniref:LPXTG cell wall anchor domain-containing protein n=1 Tax=Levilactobacillus tujiorum TaxID=2912243 RepID=A0ABX1L6B2_9LACO|nr:MucBP domain-containing protein [Levilactobacillus tujiorum]MCH5465494.1 LPXTG cell wall anchor domain-containing protein [Levilactobacillus tujiorum]NLR12580.1 LPXTG cell wall anchor domain-containing protein [Lactobacillus sp. HBUAS51387]NLR29783.1 LPXTG cell wall anchor domain-containing protein [Levilactobacillus tujiorum]
MDKKLRGMYDCRPKFSCHRKYQYLGLLGVSLFALSFSQLKPVQAKADATESAAEQVVTQSNRDSVVGDATEGAQKPEKQVNVDSNVDVKSTEQSNQQTDKTGSNGTSAPQPTQVATPSSKTVPSTSVDSDTGTITVHHYKKGTTERLAPDDELPVTIGQTYAATPKAIRHYRPVNQANTTGIYSGHETAYFYYEAKAYPIRIKYQLKLSDRDRDFAGIASDTVTWKTKVLQVPYGEPYTIPVLNFEDDGIYVIKNQLPKSLTSIMEGKPLNVTINYGGLSNRTVWNRKQDTLTHYSTDPNGILRYAELDENEASHTLLTFTFPQNSKRIEMVMLNNDSGDHVRKLYLEEAQRLTVTLLDGSRHIIQVKNGVVYDRLLTGSKKTVNEVNGRPVAAARLSGKASSKAAPTANEHQGTRDSAQLPQTSDRTSIWLSVFGLVLLALTNITLALRKLERR